MPAVLEPVGRAFKKARAAMSRGDIAEKLEAALAELRRLVASQQAEKDQSNKAMAALSQYGQRTQAAAGAFNQAVKNGTSDEIQAAFEAWVRLKSCAAEAQQIVVGLTRDSYRDTGAQWLADNPNANQVLSKVAALRVAVAKAELDRVTAEEQRRLDSLGEFSATDSPVTKRQAAKVNALQSMLNGIESQDIQDVFTNLAGTLLEWK